MWQQRGSSNNDVVLELWTRILAGFLSVCPSAARQSHSTTDIKLSLPKCNKGISLQREREDTGQCREKKKKQRRERTFGSYLHCCLFRKG